MYKVEIIKTKRKTIEIQIKSQELVVVRAPLYMKILDINTFIKSKEDWIISNLEKFRHSKTEIDALPPFTREEIKNLKLKARDDIQRRVDFFKEKIGVSVGRITIRSQRTIWGSCSGRGNLSFNCLLMLCPEEVRDYVVVHELCHLKEMNHSKRFWKEVKHILPNYETYKEWLKNKGKDYIIRLR